MLVRSAHSANIKERRDSSTALFDPRGLMVMQAEHIPVHLGAMPFAVAEVVDEEQSPGDAWILNDPFQGGTHLPDVTVVSPVFAAGELVGFAASRAHHADIGGQGAGLDARRLAHARRGGRGDRAHAAGRGGRARPRAAGRPHRRACAIRASGWPTCAPSWPPTAPAPSGCASWRSRWAAESLREGLDGDPGLRRAAHPRGDRRAGRGRARGRRRAGGGRGRPGAAPGRHGRRRRPHARLHRLGRRRARATSTARWR